MANNEYILLGTAGTALFLYNKMNKTAPTPFGINRQGLINFSIVIMVLGYGGYFISHIKK